MPTDAPPPTTLADFSGRLSPMLVKELRQGLRTNLFVVAFILLQTFMVLCLMAGLADPNSNDADGFFWFFIVATLVFVQPLRGFNALSNEYLLNTMELIRLTKLGGWRIVFGKWTALNAQSLLFIVGVLPYLVIRYFLGNVDFISDILALVYIGLASALISAYTIGVSVFKSVILRGLLVGGVGFLLLGSLPALGFGLARAGFLSGFSWAGFWLAFGMICYGCFFFLSFGASRISARSENYAVTKRTVALCMGLLCLIILATSLDEEFVLLYSWIILGLACVDALTEPLPIYSRVLARARRQPLTRPLALFFTPGWLSGIAFFLLCCGVWLGLFVLVELAGGDDFLDDNEGPLVFLSFCNLIIFPLLPIHLFFPKHASGQFTFGVYIFIQAALGVVTLLVAVMGEALGGRYEDMLYLCLGIPSVLWVGSQNASLDGPIPLAIAILTSILCIAVPLLRNRESVREFFRNLKSPSSTDA